MNNFLIGNDNTQNGAFFPIGHDFYPRMPQKEAEFWLATTTIQIRKINSDSS